MKTPAKQKSKPLTKNQIVSAVKEMLIESIREILKSIHLNFKNTHKKLDYINESTTEIMNVQTRIMDKLRDHERRIRELESGFMKN